MTVSIEIRGLLIESVLEGIADGSLELGAGIRRLRVEVAKMQQAQFARMCKISVRALIQIEQGEGNPTLKSLNSVFRPLDCRWGSCADRTDCSDCRGHFAAPIMPLQLTLIPLSVMPFQPCLYQLQRKGQQPVDQCRGGQHFQIPIARPAIGLRQEHHLPHTHHRNQ